MNKIILVLTFILGLSFGTFAQKVPTFRQYSAKVEKTKAKSVNLASHKYAKTYRTNLRNAFKEGVNFGGHFMLVNWGCGTNCSQTAIIDSRTGKVFFPTELAGAGFGFCDLGDQNEPLKFKSDSSLLILYGFKGGDLDNEKSACGIYYYKWTGTALQLVKFVKKKRQES